eukprot:5073191-Pleurochrysis_carterae.AAC.2
MEVEADAVSSGLPSVASCCTGEAGPVARAGRSSLTSCRQGQCMPSPANARGCQGRREERVPRGVVRQRKSVPASASALVSKPERARAR